MHAARYRLPHDAQAAAEARRALDPLGPSLDPEAMDELRLLVSELVTNAVRHGGPIAEDEVELGVWLDDDSARIEVVDGGDGFSPSGNSPDGGQPGGWGLVVVDRLADRWGIERDGGTRVWVEFSLLADAASV
jgi:anti-sigma regulatory factor (Ser/Thr protein kinase)